ncbi:MAG: NPCBM/NEW2 domain-containing protein [Solirubrobacteraceae bacterium]
MSLLALALVLPGSASAKTQTNSAGKAVADTTIVVDDATQGSGLDEFDYVGSDWGHAGGEGAPANPYDGTNSWANSAGDKVTFTFVGTQITFYGITDPGHGIGDISMDGATPTAIDFYSAHRTGNVSLWTSPTLPEGQHTLTLTWTGQKNPASTGTFITVDRVSYVGQPPPPVHTDIPVNLAGPGRTFDGIGAISGGGGNSRLLIDYPPKQRQQILDYLFKPGYGADLQLLKIEIGGDANSTDGAEPSIEHTKGTINCNVGYEFWLAEQAKKLNPNIKLYGLAWAAPGWIGNGTTFWSPDSISYLMSWLGCAKQHGLNIDYLGGWNERGYNATWYEELHAALAANGYSNTKVVADDSGWDEADAMATDPKFANSVDILAAHYSCEGGDGGNADSCSTTQNALNSGKPLWDSEQGSQDDNTGAGPLIRAITRGYIDAKMTALLNWPLIAAITPNLPYPTDGMMVANQPWSGHYSVGTNTWVTAQVTQFTQPGWRFLDGGSGYLGGDRTNGSYVSLKSPDDRNFSTIVETTTATAAQTATFTVSGGLQTGKKVQVWATNVNSTSNATHFRHLANLIPDGSGAVSYTLQPGYVYTFSTLSTAGKGTAMSPPGHPLGLPYRDNFNEYAAGQEARYLSDMQGAFEAQPCAASRAGMCIQQMAPVKPIEWQPDSDAYTLLGDPTWRNYTVSSDVELARPGTVELIGRAGTQNRPQADQQGYYLQVSSTGQWKLIKSDDNGNRTVLARASVAALGTGTWHRLALTFVGHTITASIDGHAVGVVRDASYSNGQIGLGIMAPTRPEDPSQYVPDQFDNLAITPASDAALAPVVAVHAQPASVQRGKDLDVTASFSMPLGAAPARGVTLALNPPKGFTSDDTTPQVFGIVRPGQRVTATWQLTAPVDSAGTATLSVLATFAQGQVAHWQTGTGQVQVTNPPAPTGTVAVSSLPFLSSTNGWGPVERNESVGGNQPNDGQTITINGMQYAQGLGTNSISDVKLYLGANCSNFTSTVGMDDEVGNSGTVTFSVIGDGKTLAATQTIKGGDPAQQITANVTGVQVLDLVVGDAGDGNANDHGDWAAPTLTCSS